MAKMQLKIAKMLLKIVKKHSYNYFVVNLPLSDERSHCPNALENYANAVKIRLKIEIL